MRSSLLGHLLAGIVAIGAAGLAAAAVGAANVTFFEREVGSWHVSGTATDSGAFCSAFTIYEDGLAVGAYASVSAEGGAEAGVYLDRLAAGSRARSATVRFGSGAGFTGWAVPLDRGGYLVRLDGHGADRDFFDFWARQQRVEITIGPATTGWLSLKGTMRSIPALAECLELAITVEGLAPPPREHARPERSRAVVKLDDGWVEYEGELTPAGVDRAIRLLPQAPRGVWLNSAGGSVGAAVRLADAVRRAGKATGTYRLCASACVIALAGGVERSVEASTRIGVHQLLWRDRADEREVQASLGQLGRFYERMGVDAALVLIGAETPPEGMRWLSLDEVQGLRLATHVYRARS